MHITNAAPAVAHLCSAARWGRQFSVWCRSFCVACLLYFGSTEYEKCVRREKVLTTASHLRPPFRHSICLQIVMINPSQLLTEANNNACTMLIKMTTPAGEGMAKTKAVIPLPSLRDCSGLQFFDLKLIGAAASYLHGSAFTIRKLGKQDGTTQWSAPCFFQMHQIGLGLTVGYDDIKTVVVLGSDSAVHKAQSKVLLGADLDLIVGKNSAVVQSDVSETQAIPYSMADGALLDISVKGGRVTVDAKLNRQLYGSSISADHILAGDVDAPDEMKPLYNIIHRLIVAAGTSI